jgi:chromosome segregation ATPase
MTEIGCICGGESMLDGTTWLALGVIAGALVLARLWRTAESRADRLQTEVEALAAEGKQLASSLSKEVQARKRQAEELATLRNKADKAKRRQAKPVDQPLGTTARIRDHEAQLERVQIERDRGNAERDVLVQEVGRLEARLAVSARALEDARAPIPVPIASETENALERVTAELATSREQVTKLNDELEVGRRTEGRMRKRTANQEQLYASLRSELDVKKDRLRTQEEQLQRLQALKVAVME